MATSWIAHPRSHAASSVLSRAGGVCNDRNSFRSGFMLIWWSPIEIEWHSKAVLSEITARGVYQAHKPHASCNRDHRSGRPRDGDAPLRVPPSAKAVPQLLYLLVTSKPSVGNLGRSGDGIPLSVHRIGTGQNPGERDLVSRHVPKFEGTTLVHPKAEPKRPAGRKRGGGQCGAQEGAANQRPAEQYIDGRRRFFRQKTDWAVNGRLAPLNVQPAQHDWISTELVTAGVENRLARPQAVLRQHIVVVCSP